MVRFHLPSIEGEQLKKWEDRGIFRKVLDKKSPKGAFRFFEGPPTANGKPGIHHMLTRAFKDIILRFRTMQGYHIDRKAGWDTHGLPVELEVEKQLGFTKKQDIEEYGIAKFNAKCRESVWTYLDQWQDITKRTAFWVDMDDPYITYENGFVESLWWVLKEIDKKGLLYQGYRVTPHCPRCVTSLSSHELAQGYKDTDDPSVFVKFRWTEKRKGFLKRFIDRLLGRAEKHTAFLVWTTTPWTLPGNVAVAVGADVTYVKARMENGEVLVLAKELLGTLDGETYEVIEEVRGESLVGTSYVPLFDTMPDDEKGKEHAYKAYAADFVSTSDGTGIVHVAPAFGEDDYELGKRESLPTLRTVDPTGHVTAEVPGKGKFFKKADKDISDDLTSRGLMFREETYTHTYPFCWRCSTPLLYYAKGSWYIAMSKLRDDLVANNKKINWIPSHIRDGRFGEWLNDVKDWALSRERYWGTPLPVWKCGACDAQKVMGGLGDIVENARPKNRYLLQRHGEAGHNLTNTLASFPEPDGGVKLTEKGEQMIRDVSNRLKDEGVDVIVSSDLRRTKQTAGIIAEELGLGVAFDERLRDTDFGDMNGMPISVLKERFGTRVARFTEAPEGGETLRQVRHRIIEVVKELEAKYEGKTILLVSHGDPLWMLESGIKHMTDEESDGMTYNHVGEYRELDIPRLPMDPEGRVDMHRPFIDEVILRCGCGGDMIRVPDVCDVWFDSGAMPFAQWHYPFENRERIDERINFPADFISEAIDQTRGWFYTLLAVSTLLGYEEPPYKNVICLGHVLDAKGQKMSKSKGNTVDPWEMIDKHGADAIRLFFFTVNQPGEPKRFDEKAVLEVTKKTFLILWNVLSFYRMFAGAQRASVSVPAPKNELDRWILARLARLTDSMTEDLEKYHVVDAGRDVAEFITDMSQWYVRRSRGRFKSDDKDEAVMTLGHVLLTLSKLLAPFTPFLADALYDELGGTKESVHLDEWPGEDVVAHGDDAILGKMDEVRKAASVGLERRASEGMPVRQVLASATVQGTIEFEDWMKIMVAQELNVDEVRWKKAEMLSVELDTELTPDLKRRGALRVLVRNMNDLRKGAKLTIGDRIVIHTDTESEFWSAVLDVHGVSLQNDTLADALERGRKELEHMKELDIDGERIWIGFTKVG